MAVRRPLYVVGGNLREMSDSQIATIQSQVAYQYSLNPSVTLSVVTSGGSLGTYSDTRQQAGTYLTFTNRFPTEGETAEPNTITVNYSRVDQTIASTTEPTDTSNLAFPAFSNGGNIQAMSATDVYDTFVSPAIDTLTSGAATSAQGGTYTVSTSSSLSGATLVSATPIFSDTRANTGAYSAAGIPETTDQPFTVTNYYLHRLNGVAASNYPTPVFIRASDYSLQLFTKANYDTQIQNFVRHAAASVTGSQIRYSINGTGSNRGTGMVNTVLNGSGNYQTLFVDANDYRAQEFPDGTAVTANTYYLRIDQV